MRQPSNKRVGVLIAAALGTAIVLTAVAFVLPRQMVLGGNIPRSSSVSPVTRAVPLVPSEDATPKVVPAVPTEIMFTVNGNVTVKNTIGTVYANQHSDGSWDAITPPEASSAELSMAYWWGNGLSFMPGDPSSGTTYIYGHTCAKWSGCAFNELKYLRVSDRVTVTTSNSVLTYEVIDSRPVPKAQLSSNGWVYQAQTNRLVLITCITAGDAASSQHGVPSNLVVELTLASSQPLN